MLTPVFWRIPSKPWGYIRLLGSLTFGTFTYWTTKIVTAHYSLHTWCPWKNGRLMYFGNTDFIALAGVKTFLNKLFALSISSLISDSLILRAKILPLSEVWPFQVKDFWTYHIWRCWKNFKPHAYGLLLKLYFPLSEWVNGCDCGLNPLDALEQFQALGTQRCQWKYFILNDLSWWWFWMKQSSKCASFVRNLLEFVPYSWWHCNFS